MGKGGAVPRAGADSTTSGAACDRTDHPPPQPGSSGVSNGSNDANTPEEQKSNLHVRAAKLLVAQSCLTLCGPTDCSPPGSSVRGIFHANTPEYSRSPGDLPDPGTEPVSPACRRWQ